MPKLEHIDDCKVKYITIAVTACHMTIPSYTVQKIEADPTEALQDVHVAMWIDKHRAMHEIQDRWGQEFDSSHFPRQDWED